MHVELRDVSKGPRGEALPVMSLGFCSGKAVLALAETEQRPTVLGLIASGRMAADTGTVVIDGMADAASLRRRVALVDAPAVSDPAPNITVAGVTAEELMFAGRAASPLAVRRWLDANDLADVARTPIADVTPSRRIRLLLELTALREGVDGMVLVAPDRHGGSPAHWWEVVEEFASRGLAMLVVAGAAAAGVLDGYAERAEIPDAAPAAHSESEVEPEPEPETEPERELASAPDPELAAEPEAESVPDVEAEPEPVSESKLLPDVGAAPEPVGEPEAVPEPGPGPVTPSDPDDEPDPQHERSIA